MEEKIWWMHPKTSVWLNEGPAHFINKIKEKWEITGENRIINSDAFKYILEFRSVTFTFCAPEFANMMIAPCFISSYEKKEMSMMGFRIGDFMYEQGYIELARELYHYTNQEHGSIMLLDKKYKELIKGEVRIPPFDLIKEFLEGSLVLQKAGSNTHQLRQEILEKLLPLVIRWRRLEFPRSEKPECYEIVRDYVELGIRYRAFRVANVFSCLLFVCDRKRSQYAESSFLVGRNIYEQGVMEFARQCFCFSGWLTKDACFQPTEYEKYRALAKGPSLSLEYTQEVLEAVAILEQEIANGTICHHTLKEMIKINAYRRREESKQKRYLKQQKEKMDVIRSEILQQIKTVEGQEPEQGLRFLEEALARVVEPKQEWHITMYLYLRQGDLYFRQRDYTKALQAYQNGYACKVGNNGFILYGLAIAHYALGEQELAREFVYRAYAIEGMEFMLEKGSILFREFVPESVIQLEYQKEYTTLYLKIKAFQERLQKRKKPERQPVGETKFALLLGGVQAVLARWEFDQFNLSSAASFSQAQLQLSLQYGIKTRADLESYLERLEKQGPSAAYERFQREWEEGTESNASPLNPVTQWRKGCCERFAKGLYEIAGEKGIKGWEIGEGIRLLRQASSCGILGEKEGMEWALRLAKEARRYYGSWEEYAIGYLCGASYYVFQTNDFQQAPAEEMVDFLIQTMKKLFFGRDHREWSLYEWPK